MQVTNADERLGTQSLLIPLPDGRPGVSRKRFHGQPYWTVRLDRTSYD